MPILSFRSKALEAFFKENDARRLSVKGVERLTIILARLDAASTPEDMNLPGLYFHTLKGKDKGRYSVRVTGNWRLTFAWEDGDAIAINLEDYH